MRGDELADPPSGIQVPLVDRAAKDILFRAPGRCFTAAAFLEDVQSLAASLPDAGHVANLCQDRYRFAVAFCAALLRGQVSLLSSDHSADRLHVLARRYPDAYALTDERDAIFPIALAGGNAPMVSPRAIPSRHNASGIPATRLAAIVFTSGSTGEPVGHPKRWGALAARSGDAGRRFAMHRSEPACVIGMVPPQHMYGFETTVLLPLHASASSWCGPAFFPQDVRTALEAVPGPRVLVTTPLQIRALLQAGIKLPALHRVISATAPLYAELAIEAEARWDTELWEIFGATEVGSIASRRLTRDDTWTAYPRVRLDDPAASDDAVLVTGPFADPTPLSDLVDRLDGMRFRLLGRRTDVVKLGGRRTSLAGLDRVLTSIAGVVDGCFVAPDDLDRRPTARLVAFVVAPGMNPEGVMAGLRGRIDPLFLPRRIIQLDALPRNATGKLPEQAVAALRAQVAGG